MKKVVGTHDRVVLVSEDDNSTCEILDVKEEVAGMLHCDGYILNSRDAGAVKVSEKGRVFFYNASIPYINECSHLSQVEQNLVINKAMTFKGDIDQKKGPGFFMYFIVGILAVALIFK